MAPSSAKSSFILVQNGTSIRFGPPSLVYEQDESLVVALHFLSTDEKNYWRHVPLDLHQLIQLVSFLSSIISKEEKANSILRLTEGNWPHQRGAYVKFLANPSNKNTPLIVELGFYSSDDKRYARFLHFELHRVEQLRDYLNGMLANEALKNKYCYLFSYGSNMFIRRLRDRAASAQVVRTHELKGYKLIFNKKSQDGSVKANLVKSHPWTDSVWGVIQKILLSEKPELDKHEGAGYQCLHFPLIVDDAHRKIHFYGEADGIRIQSDGMPYEWYKAFVIKGAIENGLPEEYIEGLKSINSQPDPDQERDQRNRRLLEGP